MVAPILGLIAAAAAKPHYENYASSVKANAVNRRAERAGVDLNTASPDELNRFGMQNGLIDFAQGQGNAQQAQQFGMQHDLSLQQHDLSERRFGLQEAQFDHARFLDGLNAAQGMLPDYSGTDANGVLDVTALTNAHVNMESGDNYQALGPVISNPNSSVYGEQALGRYQVMPSTMRRWTKELFGKEMTEDEFLNSPTAQDFVYRKKFLEVAQNEGVANALSKWHSGKSFADAAAAGVADQNMSTVNYVNSVMSNMKRESAALEEQRLKGWLAENNSEGLRTLENPYAPQPAKDAVKAEAIGTMQRNAALQAGNQSDPFTSAQTEAQQAFIPEQQRRADLAIDVAAALKVMSTDLFSVGNWAETEVLQSKDFINRLLFKQRMDYQRATYGDTEPPPAVQEQIAEMFPLIEGARTWKGKRADRIKQNLRILQQSNLDQSGDAASELTRQGFELPLVEGRGSLPPEYEVVQ